MPAASGAKGDIVLSAPTDGINDILDVLTEDDYEGEFRELSGPTQTSALIVRAIGKNQTPREFTPRGSELILHVCRPSCSLRSVGGIPKPFVGQLHLRDRSRNGIQCLRSFR